MWRLAALASVRAGGEGNVMGNSDFLAFQRACGRWQRKFGLTDWRIDYKSMKDVAHHGAAVQASIESRHAIITYNLVRETGHTIEQLACHEIMHLLFADFGATAAIRADRHHPDAQLEEHRAIERLLAVLM